MRERLVERCLAVLAGDAATHCNAKALVLRPQTVDLRLEGVDFAPLASLLDLPDDHLPYSHDVPSLLVPDSRPTPVAGMRADLQHLN